MSRSARFIAIFFLALFVGGFHIASAAFNTEINYQGKLTDTSNNAVADGDYNFKFRLCITVGCTDGSDPVWTETREGTDKVTVTSGIFSVLLGSVTSIASVNFNQSLWLEVQVGGTGTPSYETLTPRKKLGAVAASFTTALDTIGDPAASSTIEFASTTLTIDSAAASSTFVIDGDTGRIGIGATSPTSTLDVAGEATFGAGTERVLVIPSISLLTGGGNAIAGSGAGAALTSGTNNTLFGVSAGNAIISATGNTFIGYQAGLIATGGSNVAIGVSALDANTTGTANIAIGRNALGANVGASDNTAIGDQAMLLNISGVGNVAIGTNALSANTASYNTAAGWSALDANTSGVQNIAIGKNALGANTTGGDNIAIGDSALDAQTGSGIKNIAIGTDALTTATSAINNVAIGYQAMDAQTTGDNNVAVGRSALGVSTTGDDNVAIGDQALDANTTGDFNVAIGSDALGANTTASNNTALGYQAGNVLTTGIGNIILGSGADPSSATANNEFVAGSATSSITNVYFGEGPLDATPLAYTINGGGGLGTDIAGAALQLAGGKGTGAGAGGSIIFQTTAASSTGSTLNILETRMTITSAGLVGIGADPASGMELDVAGQIQLDLAGTQTSVALCGSHTAAGGASVANVEIVDCTGTPGADYMEIYPVEQDAELGDIVTTGTGVVETTTRNRVSRLARSSRPYQPNVIGIVSDPSQAGDFNSIGYNIKLEDNPMPVALNGRVPVKASLENGPIAAGDYITSSSIAGVGMKATKPGRVIGIALDSFHENDEDGMVMIFINPHWSMGSLGENGLLVGVESPSSETSANQGGFMELVRSAIESFTGTVKTAGNWVFEKITAKTVRVEKIELVDQKTGGIYCTWLENGEWVKVQGDCDQEPTPPFDSAQGPPPATTSPDVSGGGEPTPTPEPLPEEVPLSGGTEEEPTPEPTQEAAVEPEQPKE